MNAQLQARLPAYALLPQTARARDVQHYACVVGADDPRPALLAEFLDLEPGGSYRQRRAELAEKNLAGREQFRRPCGRLGRFLAACGGEEVVDDAAGRQALAGCGWIGGRRTVLSRRRRLSISVVSRVQYARRGLLQGFDELRAIRPAFLGVLVE